MLVLDKIPDQKHFDLIHPTLDNQSKADLLKSKKVEFLGDLLDLKKQRAKWDHEHSKLFLVFGLVISLAFVISVFEWKTYEHGAVMDLGMVKNDFAEILEIPPTEQTPPPPPQKILAPVIVEVDDEQIIKDIALIIDVETKQEMTIEAAPIFDFVTDAPEEKVEEIFDIVESRPEPVGGLSAFYKYVSENIEYPERARRLDIQGRVFLQFVVEKDGSLTDVKVIKSLYEDCDAEAISVIEHAPKWIPGKQRGKAVRVNQRIPISFILRKN